MRRTLPINITRLRSQTNACTRGSALLVVCDFVVDSRSSLFEQRGDATDALLTVCVVRKKERKKPSVVVLYKNDCLKLFHRNLPVFTFSVGSRNNSSLESRFLIRPIFEGRKTRRKEHIRLIPSCKFFVNGRDYRSDKRSETTIRRRMRWIKNTSIPYIGKNKKNKIYVRYDSIKIVLLRSDTLFLQVSPATG